MLTNPSQKGCSKVLSIISSPYRGSQTVHTYRFTKHMTLEGMIPFTEAGINRRYPLNPSSSSRAFGTCVVCLPPILPPPTRTWPNHDLWVWASWRSRTHLCCCYHWVCCVPNWGAISGGEHEISIGRSKKESHNLWAIPMLQPQQMIRPSIRVHRLLTPWRPLLSTVKFVKLYYIECHRMSILLFQWPSDPLQESAWRMNTKKGGSSICRNQEWQST